MLIVGINEKLLKTETVPDKCLHCFKNNVISISVFQKYAHLFYIPMFPIKKTATTTCSHCKEKLFLKEITSSLNESYLRIKRQTKTPWWTFIGLFIIAALILNEEVRDTKKHETSKMYLLSPKIGDFYEIKTTDDLFTLYKIEKIDQDSIYFKHCKNEYFSKIKLTEPEVQYPSNFTNNIYSIPRKDLKSMFDKEIIVDIDRK